MMKVLRTILLIIATVSFFSCGGNMPHKAEINAVDSLADINPSKALAKLDRLRTELDTTSEAEMNYAKLIRIKAKDLAYIKHTSDSVIVRLVSYYEKKDDRNLLPLAYYYAGRIYSDMNDAPQALDYFQKAEKAINHLERNDKLLGKTHSQIGYILVYRGFYEKALAEFLKAYKIDKANADTTSMIFNLHDLGSTYWDLERLDSSLYYFKQAETLATSIRDTILLTDAKTQLAVFYLYHDNTSEAKRLLSQTSPYTDSLNISATLSIYADLYEKEGKIDSAVICYKKLLEHGNKYGQQGANKGLARYYLKKGNNVQALKYFDQYIQQTDSIRAQDATEAVAKSLAMYNYEQRERENNALKIKNQQAQLVAVIVSTACFVLFVLVMFLVFKHRHDSKIVRLKMEKLILFKNKIEKEKEDFSVKKLKPAKLMATEISQIVQQRIDSKGEKHHPLTDDEWQKIDQEVNNIYEKFKENAYAIYPMTQFEYRVCLLIKMKISVTNIAFLTFHSKESISSLRRRLYKKAFNKSGSPSDWDEIINSL